MMAKQVETLVFTLIMQIPLSLFGGGWSVSIGMVS